MKDRKYKYYEDLIEEYILLTEEAIEIPKAIERSRDKMDMLTAGKAGMPLKSTEAADAYKLFWQIKRHQERQVALDGELREVEELLKQFLETVGECKVPYKDRDHEDKTKTTYSFWLEEGVIKSNK